jgi:ribosome-binding factor A
LINTKKNSHKKAKYEEDILQIVSAYFRRDLRDQRLCSISITKIELNNDYSEVKIYWDTFDSTKRGDAKNAIDKVAGLVRHQLSREFKVRQIPIVKFFYDSQYESEEQITKLLKEEQQGHDGQEGQEG